jgi:phenylpyruvate tautomerase PptA (4-oxalocrotonate tautomerase family)
VIQIDIREGRTKEEKVALGKALAQAAHDTTGAPIDFTYVIIREHPGYHHIKAQEPLPEYDKTRGW